MKTLLTLTLTAALSLAAWAQAPAPITAADVPTSITFTVPPAMADGIASAYNKAVAAQYAAYVATPPVLDKNGKAISPAPFVAPTVTAYAKARIADVFKSYQSQAVADDLAATRVQQKWDKLTPAQRTAIKATLSGVAE